MLAALLQTIDPPEVQFGATEFGSAVATSNLYHVVAAPRADVSGNQDAGSVYLFDASNGTLLKTLDNPDPVAQDQMGFSVALDGNTVVAGARFDNVGGSNQAGRAFIFDASTGNLVTAIDNPTPAPNEYFGASVAVSGGIVAVGAPEVALSGSNRAGVVYLFDASNGALLDTINNPTPASNDQFGYSVAMSGTTLVVGGLFGEVVHVYDASNSSLAQTILDPATGSTFFGSSVAVSGNYVVVGSYLDDTGASDSGAAYVFSATTGGLLQTLNNPFPTTGDNFGRSVAISGNSAVIGAPRDDAVASNSGTVYEFDVLTGALISTLNNPTPDSSDEFGAAVSIAGDLLLAGVAKDDAFGSSQGIAHIFTLGPPPYEVTITATNVVENAASGTAVGTLDASPSSNPPFSFALVDGAGGDDNGDFTIVGNELRTNAVFDFESKTTYFVLVEGTDSNGLLSRKTFSINIADVNEAPTAINLSSSQVPEFQAVGTVVGLLSSTDPDLGDSFIYSLVNGTGDEDNGLFAIVNDELQAGASFDFEERTSYSVRIRSLDAGGLSIEQDFQIIVTDVNPPTPNALPAYDLRIVADINDSIQSSNPTESISFGGQAFFVASSIDSGSELYRTDGSLAGTYLVKDLLEGTESGLPRSLTEFNGELFFLSEYSYLDPGALPFDIPETRTGLWKSDGSEAGTILVKDFGMLPISPEGLPSTMHVINGNLLFFVGDPTSMEELWTSDGTELGTTMVSSFFSSGGFGVPIEMPTATLGNVLFFNRDVEPTSGSHSLWRTDGTPGGTFELRMGEMGFGFVDLDPSLTVVGSEVFFVSTSNDEGKELWKTDGTLVGTTLVKDIANGPDDSAPSHLTEVNGTLFFSADTSGFGDNRELWKSDGTFGGTTLVKDIRPGGFGSGIDAFSAEFISFNNTLYFSAQDEFNGTELWKSDGTTGGTNMLLDFSPGTGQGLWPENFLILGSKLLFTSGNFSPDGVQLWETDGTTVGTVLLADIDGPGSSAATISDFQVSGSKAFFRGNNGTEGNELWVTDGTTGGTIQLADLNPGSGSGLTSILSTGLGGVLFQGSDGVIGTELGISDGTALGTQLIDVAQGTPSAEIQSVFEFGNTIYLSAQGDLWISDGTDLGTTLVKDFPLSVFGLTDFTEVDGTVFFVAEGDLSEGRELWKTDGTTAGTVLVKDILPGSNDSDPELLTSFNDTLYFVADDGVNGKELWKSFGSSENTLLSHEFVPGSADGEIEAILPVGDELYIVADGVLYNESFQVLHPDTYRATYMPWDDLLYFAGFTPEHGYELWRTDGTQLGTYLVMDVLPGPASSYPGGGVVSEETGDTPSGAALEAKLVFRALVGANDSQLFTTDGSTSGTEQISDVPLFDDGLGNTASFTPVQLTKVGDQIYFEAFDAANGRELWITNGTATGTKFVKDLRPGTAPDPLAPPDPLTGSAFFNLEELIGFRDRLIFRTSEGATGTELWGSDSTVAGTGLAIDILSGADSGNPADFFIFQDQLYLTANTADYGTSTVSNRRGELFRLNEAPYVFDVAGTTTIDTSIVLLLSALDLDDDTLTFEIVNAPTDGTFSINGSELTYTPGSGFTGTDQFTYRAFDGSLYSQTASVEVGVTAVVNTVSFVLAEETIPEQSGVLYVDVFLAQPAATDLLIPYTIEGAVAVENGNVREGELFLLAGESMAQIVVVLDDDTRYETDPQLMEITLRANSEIALGPVSQYILTLQDDDPMPTVMFVSPWQSVGESDETLRIDVGLSAASDETVSVVVGFSFLNSATWNVDFLTELNQVVEFLPGQVRKSVLVRLVDDVLAEQREVIYSFLDGPFVGATVTSDPDRSQYLTWIDDNDTSTVSMTPSVLFESEGDVVTLTATRAGGNLTNALSAPVIVDLGGATSADYALSSTTFEFAANETTATIDVTITDDIIDEQLESLTLLLDDTGGGFALGDGTSTFIGILDNDRATISLSIGNTNAPGVTSPTSVRESYPHGGGLNWLIDVTATLSVPSTETISVPVVVSNGAVQGYASQGTDFSFSTNDFVFAPGVTEVTRTLEIFDDIDDEPDELIRITLEPTASQFELRSQGRIDDGSLMEELVIRDDDSGKKILAPKSVNETVGQFTFDITLDEPASPGVSTTFYVTGSARRGVDFTVNGSSNREVNLFFATGEQTKSITIQVLDDTLFEGSEVITLQEVVFFNGEFSLGQSKTVLIKDNESKPLVSFAPTSSFALVENSGPFTIDILLDSASSESIEIDLSFGGSAVLGQDYAVYSSDATFIGPGVLSIDPGVTSVSVTFYPFEDGQANGDTTITATITGGSNVTIPKKKPSTERIILDSSRPAGSKVQKYTSSTVQAGVLGIDTEDIDIGAPLGIPDFSGIPDRTNIIATPTTTEPGIVNVGSGSNGLLLNGTVYFDANFNFTRDFLDLDEDGFQDADEPLEPEVQTALDGTFRIVIPVGFDVDGSGFIESSEGRFVLGGGLDTATNLSWQIPLAAPGGALAITPISTLVENVTRRFNLSIEQAGIQVGQALGISGFDFSRGDAIYEILANDTLAANAYAQQVQISSAVILISSLVDGSSNFGFTLHAGELYDLLGDQIANGNAILDFSNEQLNLELLQSVNTRLATPLTSDILDGAAELIALGASRIQSLQLPDFASPRDFLSEITKIKKLLHGVLATDLADVGAGTRTIADVLADYNGATAPNFDSIAASQVIGQIIPPALGISNAIVTEGDSGQQVLEFTIGINGDHDNVVSVDYTTIDDSAKVADGDYQATSGTITWLAGDTTFQTVQVPINGDTAMEPDELVRLLLRNAQNAVIRIPEGFGYILNDESLSLTATANPGNPTEFTVVHGREFAEFSENGSLVFGGEFANGFGATLNGQLTESNLFDFDFSEATYRSDQYTVVGGSANDELRLAGGQFDQVIHQVAGPTAGKLMLQPSDGNDISIDWVDLEGFYATVSDIDNFVIHLHSGISDVVIEDPDPLFPGVMRISSPSFQFAPIDFTVPASTLTIVTTNPAANIQTLSTDPDFTGTIELLQGGVQLSSTTILEGAPVGTTVAMLTSLDPLFLNGFTTTLVSGVGDTDNSFFTIINNELTIDAAINYASVSTLSLRTETTNSGGQSVQQIVVLTIQRPADFNTDGNVDGADLSIWEGNFGTVVGAILSTGDSDEDGDVDGFDFLAWQRGFGTPIATIASSVSGDTADDEETEQSGNEDRSTLVAESSTLASLATVPVEYDASSIHTGAAFAFPYSDSVSVDVQIESMNTLDGTDPLANGISWINDRSTVPVSKAPKARTSELSAMLLTEDLVDVAIAIDFTSPSNFGPRVGIQDPIREDYFDWLSHRTRWHQPRSWHSLVGESTRNPFHDQSNKDQSNKASDGKLYRDAVDEAEDQAAKEDLLDELFGSGTFDNLR